MIKVSKTDTVYIMAPAASHTGGPELLHQLGSELMKNGCKVFMYYYPNLHPYPVHKNYKKYNVPFVRLIPDNKSSIVVVPEVQIPRSLSFSKATIAIWWLSVDNFYAAWEKFKKEKIFLRWLKFGSLNTKIDWDQVFKKPYKHFAQSFYAIKFLESKGITNSIYLSDYLSPVFLNERLERPKQDYVCYNPKKGARFTEKIIAAAPHMKFIPLIGMSPNQLKECLASAKVYIDFGEHPGKDRIPREAAFLGACVIVGKQGSAVNKLDVTIPEEFKISIEDFNEKKVIQIIESCLSNYDEQQRKFEPYYNKIKSEHLKFQEDVKNAFSVE